MGRATVRVWDSLRLCGSAEGLAVRRSVAQGAVDDYRIGGASCGYEVARHGRIRGSR